MPINEWPSAERPREKLLERGAAALSDAELLAVLIGSGSRRASAVDLGRELLVRFGSLRELLRSERARCLEQPGFGPARYATLQAALELARRHYREILRAGPALTSPDATRSFLLAQLRDRPYEVFCCLHLDNRHRLIAFEELFRGTIDGASVHPREVVRQTLAHNAAAVIVAHYVTGHIMRLMCPGPFCARRTAAPARAGISQRTRPHNGVRGRRRAGNGPEATGGCVCAARAGRAAHSSPRCAKESTSAPATIR